MTPTFLCGKSFLDLNSLYCILQLQNRERVRTQIVPGSAILKVRENRRFHSLKCVFFFLVSRYYKSNDDIIYDNELQGLVNELSADGTVQNGGGNVSNNFTVHKSFLHRKNA